jgi:hypothetical protein
MTQLSSGIMEGSRWGLKGTEDMGGGYKTIFTLEARVELDTGSNSNRPASGSQLSDRFSQASLLGLPSDAALGLPTGTVQGTVTKIGAALANEFGVNVGASGNRAFDRQAFVGLITPVGAVLAGGSTPRHLKPTPPMTSWVPSQVCPPGRSSRSRLCWKFASQMP